MTRSTKILTTLFILALSTAAMGKGPSFSKGGSFKGATSKARSMTGGGFPSASKSMNRGSFSKPQMTPSNMKLNSSFPSRQNTTFKTKTAKAITNPIPSFKPGNINQFQPNKPSITNRIPGLKPSITKPGLVKPGIIKPGIIKPGIIKPELKPLGPLKPLNPFKPNKPLLPEIGKIPGLVPGGTNSPKPKDDHDHHHGWINLLKPICLPPIVNCPPPRVCPPCVLAVCPHAEVVVVEQSTEQILVDFLAEPTEPAFVVDLQVDTEVSLEVDGLSEVPGALVLDVNGIGLPVEILGSEGGLVSIKVPSVGLSEPHLGKLYVLNADLQLVAAVDARLHPAAN